MICTGQKLNKSLSDATRRWSGFTVFGELLGLDRLDREPAGVGAEDHQAYDGGAGEQEYPKHSGVQGRVAQQDAYQPEGGAGGAEGEIEALAAVGGVAQQDQKHSRNDGVDGEQGDAASDFVSVKREGLGVGERGLQRGDTEKDDGVDERDDGALAAVQDGERVHGERLNVIIGDSRDFGQ